MKKLLTLLAFCGFVSTASALSLTWQATTIAFDGATLKNSTAVTAYLVFIGNNASLAESYNPSSILTTLKPVSTVEGANSRGSATTSYNFPATENYASYNNNVYGILLSYVSEGKTYYNLSSATYKVSGVADTTSSLEDFKPATSTFSYGTKTASGSVTAGGGWVAVPEPSTAALALAGLALLLKRRKA